MTELSDLSLRQLQQESALAIVVIGGDNHTLSQFNKQANHDSVNWYRAILQWYIREWGDLPSKTGPAKDIKLIMDSNVPHQ
jgi:hypothetical protein